MSITTQKVAAVLRKAGHKASKSRATRIRGLRDHSPGFVVRQMLGEIAVDYHDGALSEGT